ncbi:hypothetical protein LTR84_003445 [Exophiala bonariae]|uniref:NB-ARC domain-containing protein n=1 Tax=Exophiala bonariae TaxID=1690606 RepID=A0AAV9N703_9EURO|nr:hypothetical protein LTR84_003445 [Exophiala bonariae]
MSTSGGSHISVIRNSASQTDPDSLSAFVKLDTNASAYCDIVWNESLVRFEIDLGPLDSSNAQGCTTYQQLRENVDSLEQLSQSTTTVVKLQHILHGLNQLITFMDLLMGLECIQLAGTSIVWGILDVLLKLSVTSKKFSSFVDMFEETAGNLDRFGDFKFLLKQDASLGCKLIDSLADVVACWVLIIRALRYSTRDAKLDTKWALVEVNHKKYRDSIQARTQHLKDKSEAHHVKHITSHTKHGFLIRDLEKLTTGFVQSTDMFASDGHIVPCRNNIPYPQNPHFCFRQKELDAIRSALDHDPGDIKFRTFAVWGMGGIGKPQLALAYAREREAKGVPVILWVNSETQIDIYQSFTNIAELLELEDRKMSVEWLLVFDNVENPDLIRICLPVSPKGPVLITSRADIVAVDPASQGIEIDVFTKDEGAEFLRSIIKRKSYSETENQPPVQLAERLGGLPLALNLMATQIRTKRAKISVFLHNYEADFERYHKTPEKGVQNTYYRHSLETVYRTSFLSLHGGSIPLLGVFCFVAPDGVPEEIFKPVQVQSGIPELEFCHQSSEFEDVIEQLTSVSLIGRDPDTETFRVHRLMQEQYRIWAGPEGRRKCFLMAAKLLCQAFPRYLMECGAWSQFRILINVAFDVCEDKTSIEYAHLLMSAASVEYESGKAKNALSLIDRAMEIRKDLLPPDHEEIANLYNNYANIYLTREVTPESLNAAEQTLLRALEIDMKKDKFERNKILHTRQLNLTTTYIHANNFEKAEHHVAEAQRFAVNHFGPKSHFWASGESKRGNIMFQQHKFEEAKKHFQNAHEVYLKANENHPSTSSAEMKLGDVAMEQNRVDDAIKLYEQAHLKFQMNEIEKGDRGDSARAIWKLSKAYEKK